MHFIITTTLFIISSSLWACDDSQLKKIDLIKEKINEQRVGLDLEKDLEEVKLHIAYSLTEKKDCDWNNELEVWYQTELARLNDHLENRRAKSAKIQEKQRVRFKYEDSQIFEKSFYLGINVEYESIDIPNIKIEDKEHLKVIAQRYAVISNYDLINYLSSSSSLVIKKHSLAMGHYTQVKNDKDEFDVKIVRDTLPLNPNLSGNEMSKLSLVDNLPGKEIQLNSSVEASTMSAEYKEWIKVGIIENQKRNEAERKILQAEIARRKRLEEIKRKKMQEEIATLKHAQMDLSEQVEEKKKKEAAANNKKMKLANDVRQELIKNKKECPTQTQDLNRLIQVCKDSLEGMNWHRQSNFSDLKTDHKSCGYNSLHHKYFTENFFCKDSNTCFDMKGGMLNSKKCHPFTRASDGVLTMIGKSCDNQSSYRNGGSAGDLVLVKLAPEVYVACYFNFMDIERKSGLDIFYAGLVLPY